MNTQFLAKISIGLASLSLSCLVLLHALSPEIAPSWHMVSEYAFGQHGIVLTMFFFTWSASYMTLAITLLPLTQGWLTRIALVLLVITGIGAMMGGLFDIRHPLHGLAFSIGVPFLPIASFILGRYFSLHYKLVNPRLMLVVRHAPWMSFAMMGIAMAVFISALKSIGLFNPEAPPHLWTSLPEEVPKVVGYFNRLLVIAYLASIMLLANAATHGSILRKNLKND